MPAFNRFNAWTDTMVEAANCGTDQFAIALTNTAPSASNTVLADITQIAYTGFGSRNLTTTSSSQTGGVYSLVWASLTLGTTVTSATFRYVVIYDDTLAGDPLVGWYDLGAGTTIPANTSLILSGMGLDLDGAAFDPSTLFGVNDRGVVFDLSDTALLFQNSGGTGAVTYGDPVGYADDIGPLAKNATQATAGNRPLYSGVPRTLGSELASNGRFATDSDWTKGTGWTIASGVATKAAGTASVISQSVTLTAGKHYVVFFTMTRTAGTLTPQVTGGTTVADTSHNTSRSSTFTFVAQTGNTTLEFSADAAFAGTLDNVSIKEVLTFTNAGIYCDGTNDRLQTAAVDMSNSSKRTIVASFTRGWWQQNNTIFDAGAFVGAATDGASVVEYISGFRMRTRQGANIAQGLIGGTENIGAIYGSRCSTLTTQIDRTGATVADQIKARSRGITFTPTASGAAVASSANANASFTIGTGSNGSTPFQGWVHRVIDINRELTGADLANAEAWVKEGIVYGCTLGDSTVARCAITSGQPSDMWYVSSFVGGLVTNGAELANPGDRIADMLGDWNALADKSALQAVFIQIGQNDVKGRVGENLATTATVISDLQGLVNAVNSSKPAGCKTYICGLTPAGLWFDTATNPTAARAAWADVNTAIAGGGATPITGVDGRITSHVAALDDGSGNLLAIYDPNNDGVHESNEARFIIAQAWRDQLEADGLV